jgi:hypothetical protein
MGFSSLAVRWLSVAFVSWRDFAVAQMVQNRHATKMTREMVEETFVKGR